MQFEKSSMDDSPTPTEREREQIDRLLDQFEKQYQRRSTPPRIEDYVDRHPAIAKELLAELLVLDVRLRFINSEMPHPEEYKTRFPEQVDLIDRVLNSRDPHLTSLSTKLHFGSNPDSGSLSTRCIESTESGDTCSMEIDTAARNE